MIIVDVLLPIAVRAAYSYRVDSDAIESKIGVGSLVTVPIGKSRRATGVVISLRESDQISSDESLRQVEGVVYDSVVAHQRQLQFWNWLSRYYMVAIGAVAYSFLPSVLKLSTNSSGELPPLVGFDRCDYLLLSSCYDSPNKIEKLLDSLSKKPRQQSLIVEILEEINQRGDSEHLFLIGEIIAKGYSQSIITTLINEGILERKTVYKQRNFTSSEYKSECNFTQNELLNCVDNEFESKDIVLVESQKYMEQQMMVVALIDRVMRRGGKVLFITPYLNRASRYVELFESYFSQNMVIYEKGVTHNRQYDNYFKILSHSGALLVVSNRMGVGLPFNTLDLVIVEREHDQIYHGFEHEIEFNGRDAAIYLSHIHGAKCLLLSAAPSIESLRNVSLRKYGFVSDKEKFTSKLVAISRRAIARDERKFQSSSSSRRFLSNLVIEQINSRTARGEKVVLYQNRKGFATTTECGDCGAVQSCDRCNSTLVYYKSNDTLRCRYCGRTFTNISKCQVCGSHNVLQHGVGSENVELAVRELFPNLKVVRFDSSTFATAKMLRTSIDQISTGDTQIIVGTQQLCYLPKVDNITLVAVVNGDNLFSFPDYRNNERAYQLLTTLRSMLVNSKESLMVLQMSADDRFMRNFADNDFAPLYHREMHDRSEFLYPPLYKIISYQIEHRSEEMVINIANRFVAALRSGSSLIVSDAIPPVVDKVNNCYIRIVNIKSVQGEKFVLAKEFSFDIATRLFKGFKWKVRVE